MGVVGFEQSVNQPFVIGKEQQALTVMVKAANGSDVGRKSKFRKRCVRRARNLREL